MLKPRLPQKVNLIVGLISRDLVLFDKVKEDLESEFSKVDYESEIFDFKHTQYYAKEMGEDLKRRFLSFEGLIEPGELADIKIFTNNLEERYSENNRRRINIDPGYVELSKLVLASTKNYYHRVYLKNGIYAEVTLYFKRKEGFLPFDWTYPDYKDLYIPFFNKVRGIYLQKLRSTMYTQQYR